MIRESIQTPNAHESMRKKTTNHANLRELDL